MSDEFSEGQLALMVVVEPGGRAHEPAPLKTLLQVGRGADVAVNDPRVSRFHFSLQQMDGGEVHLVDLGSRNGTSLNGRRVSRARIERSDVIRAGDSVFVFDEAPAGSEVFPFGRLAGASRAMERVVAAIRLASLSREPIIIEGERGVGRSLVAEEAAARSGLADGAWRYVADVGDLPREEQEKLIGEIDAGGRRVFASTINPLDDEVGAGRIVAALRDRFMHHRIALPALRARRLDIVPIARFLVKAASGRVPAPTADFVEPLLVHDWPGNGGELKSIAAIIAERLGDRDALTGGLLPNEFHDRVGLAFESAADEPVEETEVAPTERELRALLERHRGNVSEVARHYRKDRVQLYRWLKRHNLKVEDFR